MTASLLQEFFFPPFDLGILFIVFAYIEEVEEIGSRRIELWYETQNRSNREMTWCNDPDDERAIQIITTTSNDASVTISETKNDEYRTVTCPSCGHHIEFQDQVFV